ncbi:MAG: AMP-binding protein, partial [Cyanobacteria bacterium P01_C01_bin.38]
MSERNLEYWQNKLTKLPVLEITTDKLRSFDSDYHVGVEAFVFDQEICESLKAIDKNCKTSLFSALLTTFKCLLYKYTGQEDIIVGSCIPQNDNSDFNTLAFRSCLSGDISFIELLEQENKIVTEDLKYRNFSWQQLVEKLSATENKDAGIFQVMFSLLDDWATDTPLPINVDEFESDLAFFVVESSQGLKGTIAYNQQLFEAQTIKRLIGHFENLLTYVIENPHSKLNQLQILSSVEYQQIISEWNNTAVDYPKDKCIHQLFEQQVAKTPDAIAVIWKEQQLTYRELDNRANQLANYLQSLGVKPDTLVGICINRCLEMTIGILAILKAGGAYIPLDPAYPQERLSHMLEDSGVSVLLTTLDLVSQIPHNKAKQICLDRDWDNLIANQSQQAPHSD